MLYESALEHRDAIAFCTDSEDYSYSSLKQLFDKNFDFLSQLGWVSVAVRGSNLDVARMLPVLQGNVASIFLVPSNLEESLLARFYDELEVSIELKVVGDNLLASPIQNNQSKSPSGETCWCLATSGTTGTPKVIKHTFANLVRTVKLNQRIAADTIWGMAYDITRFAGLQVFLQSFLSGAALVIPGEDADFVDQVDLFVRKNCNALSATPSYWRKVLMHKGSVNLALRYVTLGGEIADQNILNSMKSRYPEAKITHIYASTEVGVGFSVKDSVEGFPEDYLHGLEGLDMKIRDNFLYIKPSGGIPNFVTGSVEVDSDGFINTGDLVALDGGRVKFLGRASGSINVGGNKVLPEEIERCIENSGLVSWVRVYGIPSPILGSIVAADVVPLDAKNESIKKQLIVYCREKLDRFKVPAVIKVVDSIRLNSSGKVSR